ncbi:MAG: hypothetical protein M0006_09535, partial [Magnetospirillum sp.]|nr:hypothetical protein [Magnetospirillum sp.]
MTISSSSSSVTYQGNGATTVFPFPFPVADSADLQAILTDNTQSPPAVTVLTASQYSLSGVADPSGGSVTYPLAGTPLPTGQALTLCRVVQYVQTTSIVNQGGFYPEVIEAALDYLTEQTQQLADGLSRTVQVPVGSGLDPASFLSTVQAAATGAAASAAAAGTSATDAAADADTAASAAASASASAGAAATSAAQAATAVTGAVKVDTNDTAAGPLAAKLLAGANVTLAVGNSGGNETLTVAVPLGALAKENIGNGLQDDGSGNLIPKLADGTAVAA